MVATPENRPITAPCAFGNGICRRDVCKNFGFSLMRQRIKKLGATSDVLYFDYGMQDRVGDCCYIDKNSSAN